MCRGDCVQQWAFGVGDIVEGQDEDVEQIAAEQTANGEIDST